MLLLYIGPHISNTICVLILVLPLHMCPHISTTTTCVLILVLLLHMCPHISTTTTYVSLLVLLLYIGPRAARGTPENHPVLRKLQIPQGT